MPSVYTIEGTRRRKKRNGGKTAQQRRFGAAAKKCKGKKAGAFRACVRAELKRR
jgi:hypothetical protein